MKNISSTALELPGWYVEFQAAILRQSPRPGEIDQVTAESWTNNQRSLKNNLANCLLPISVATRAEKSDLLEFVRTVKIRATTTKFVAKEKFVINTKRNAPVKISYLGDNFTAWFLSGDSKTEDPIMEQTLRYHKLRQFSVDAPIITELGGEAKAETALSEMFSLMEKQKHGENGVLLNNGWANIFYIKDGAGVLRAVCVYWRGGGWGVGAGSVGDPGRWPGGYRVFSRNSVLESSEPLDPA